MHVLALMGGLGLIAATPAGPPDASSAQALIAATAGDWRGDLQYRDYQSDRWMGLPVEVDVVAQPDGVTTVRTARYDDGPKTGVVTITTVSLIDSVTATDSYASFRKGRPVDTGTAHIDHIDALKDPDHWTIVTIEKRIDGDKLAQVRETTTRDGNRLTTLKEVNPEGDGIDTWLPRNRIVLNRVPAA